MLQQTQVTRVISKYKEFLKRFPSFQSLTSASLSDVLKTWKGLGYNRRGLNLKRAAEIIVKKYQGKIPKDPKELIKLPGIGPHTAGSILAFAYNFPIPFIETNIRSVFIHFFFKDKTKIHDRDILPLVEKTLDKTNPREWYYALMDYGSHLKKSLNPSKRSLHYVRQAPFKGSHRELRSKILSYILLESTRDLKTISRQTVIPLTQVKEIIEELSKEGFIAKAKNGFKIL